ncbi:MAG: hypothetical protein LBG48_00735 [Rickettsiales bacterium]|nr:hypothetical protein [Rickettsiales bacterium]
MTDAHWLAGLAKDGLISPSLRHPPDIQYLRMVCHHRRSLVKSHLLKRNRFHKNLTTIGIRIGIHR